MEKNGGGQKLWESVFSGEKKSMTNQRSRRTSVVYNARGGIQSRIIMAAATLVVVGIFIIVLLSKKGESQKFHYDNALKIAEYGLAEAMTRLHEDFRWRDGFAAVEYNRGTYTVTLDTRQRQDTLLLTVESTGRSGSVERKMTVVLRCEVTPQGDSIWRQYETR